MGGYEHLALVGTTAVVALIGEAPPALMPAGKHAPGGTHGWLQRQLAAWWAWQCWNAQDHVTLWPCPLLLPLVAHKTTCITRQARA